MAKYTIAIVCIMAIIVFGNGSGAQAEWEFQDSGATEILWDVCFTDNLHGWAVGSNSTIIATTDGGETWLRQECPEENIRLDLVQFIDEKNGYCVSNGYLFSTNDGGWKWKKSGIPMNIVYGMFFLDTDNGWITGYGNDDPDTGPIIHTNDGGNTWYVQLKAEDCESLGFAGIQFCDKNKGWSLASYYSDPYHSTYLFRTIDGGLNWEKTGKLSDYSIKKLELVSPETLWRAKFGVSVSQDGGESWKEDAHYLNYPNPVFDIVPVTSEEAFIFCNHGSLRINTIEHTTDGGKTFEEILAIEYPGLYAMSGAGNFLWCVGNEGRVLRYRIDDDTGIGEDAASLAETELYQNIPNPFNSSTVIGFTLRKSERITVNIYDVNGRKVSTLFHGLCMPGPQSVLWNGTDNYNREVSSGVYVYEVRAGESRSSKSMILLR